jgi:hypothetical protein
LFALVTCGCVVVPRLPVDVSRAVNRDTMRVLHTAHIDLYYPEHFRAEAQALAERAEGCVSALRERTTANTGISQRRIELIFPDLPFNNAFVNPPLNGDFFGVVPTHWSQDIVTETGLLPDPGYVACHELTHYVQAQQTFRTMSGLNKAFGYTITPQYGLDSWFWEGLATYYEQKLQPGTGRLAWPAWEGMFHAAVAGKRLTGGDLSALNRRVHWGNHYLYGSHFIEFLVERYGELRLWKLVQRQGSSFFFPFIVNQRFKAEYGKTLSTLIDEFGAHLERKYPPRARPPQQRSVRGVGMNGRYARALDGSEALVTQAMDLPATLSVYAPDGSLRYDARLTDVLPSRKLVTPSASSVSGLRFSRDGQRLYFVAVDRGVVFLRARLMELDIARQRLTVKVSDLGGLGGDLSPDGASYLFVKVSGHGHVLARVELASGRVSELYRAPAGVYLSSPNYSPDGSQIVASVFDEQYAIWLFAADGKRLHSLTVPGGPVYDPSFVDAERVLFLGPHERGFQAFVYDLAAHRATRVTDAPYLVMQPRAHGGNVRFFNREGYGYTLDEVLLPARAQTFVTRALADVPRVDGQPVEPPEVVDFHEVQVAPTAAPPAGDLVVVEDQPQPLPAPARLPAVATDEAYRVFPRVLIPSIRAPAVTLASNPGASFLGAYVGGTDALGKHRWGATLGTQPASWRVSGAVGYLNTQLSPLWLGITASQLSYDDFKLRKINDQNVIFHDRHRQRDLTASASVALRTSTLELQLHGTDDRQPDNTEPEQHRALAGGTLALLHDATERTPMSSIRRGYLASLSGSLYPEALGTLHSNLADLRASLRLTTPLPISRRHTLSLGLRARGLLSGEPAPLLEVGGSQGGVLFDQPNEPDLRGYVGLPPRRRFREQLRGFETFSLLVEKIAIADLDYWYPLIIDRGTASSFSILPYFFLRQLELDLFVSAATSSTRPDSSNSHVAVGGSLAARMVWFGAFLLRYQLSQRLTDDDKLQHLITLGADLN